MTTTGQILARQALLELFPDAAPPTNMAQGIRAIIASMVANNLGGGAVLGPSPLVIARSGVAVSAPADSTEDILATIVVPPMGINGALRITAEWSYTNNANNKTLRCRLGGIGGTQYFGSVQTTSLGLRMVTTIQNRGAANSQVGSGFGITDAGAISVNKNTSAIDTTAASSLVLTGQKATAGDTLTLESYIVEFISDGN